jgi:CPA1 family monovalent cation:H+ antiporter
MFILQIAALLITLAAVFSYINYRFVKLPTTIGVMLISIVVSLSLIGLAAVGLGGIRDGASEVLRGIDFNVTLMHGMLSFLLFAGALHVDLWALSQRKWIIGFLATGGLVATTTIVAGMSYALFGWLGIGIPFVYCLLFGALIAPTDPVAVMGILRHAGATKRLEVTIMGESLFNDGVAVVVFLVLLEIATGEHNFTHGQIALLFVEEAVGGALYGLVLGWLTYLMLKSIENYQVEVLLTLALVMGGYALANVIHVSGPIAMVVAGLLIGNRGRYLAMEGETRHYVDAFWELMDEILNAVLFLLIGLEMLVFTFQSSFLTAGLIMIPGVLLARLVSVGVPVSLLRKVRDYTPGMVRVLTWGGLRGGISVALALSLPKGTERDIILAVTYVVVVFSILVQGPTVGRVVMKAAAHDEVE